MEIAAKERCLGVLRQNMQIKYHLGWRLDALMVLDVIGSDLQTFVGVVWHSA